MKTYSYKAWFFRPMTVLLAFLVVNFAIWKLFTEDIFTFEKWYNGGLDRLGYLPGAKDYRKPESTLPRKHIESPDYHGQHIDVITIGDSFSNMRRNGRDPLYQDWIASLHNLTVMNLQPYDDKDGLDTLIVLKNSGYFDKVRPRYVIFESVARYALINFARPADFNQGALLNDVMEFYRTADLRYNPAPLFFINSGNFKFLLYSILYRFNDHGFKSDVYLRDLTRPLFSVRNYRKKLLFYHEDLRYIPLATPEKVRLLNENLNEVARLLKKKGITLYFLLAANKYDVYRDYIADNPYPKNPLYDLLRKEPKSYVLVDTLDALREMVRRGEQDVYYCDDTHWSWKGAKRIVETMRF